jgi:peptide/nickel transport system ATP-binding protein
VALLRSMPEVGPERRRLDPIRGMVPSPYLRPNGCPFHTRCDRAIAGICDRVVPKPIVTTDTNGEHETRCLIYDEQYQDKFLVKETTP